MPLSESVDDGSHAAPAYELIQHALKAVKVNRPPFWQTQGAGGWSSSPLIWPTIDRLAGFSAVARCVVMALCPSRREERACIAAHTRRFQVVPTRIPSP